MARLFTPFIANPSCFYFSAPSVSEATDRLDTFEPLHLPRPRPLLDTPRGLLRDDTRPPHPNMTSSYVDTPRSPGSLRIHSARSLHRSSPGTPRSVTLCISPRRQKVCRQRLFQGIRLINDAELCQYLTVELSRTSMQVQHLLAGELGLNQVPPKSGFYSKFASTAPKYEKLRLSRRDRSIESDP